MVHLQLYKMYFLSFYNNFVNFRFAAEKSVMVVAESMCSKEDDTNNGKIVHKYFFKKLWWL